MTESPNWLEQWFFDQVLADRQRLDADPGLPAYPWLPTGERYTLPVIGLTPISFVAAVTGKRYPVLVNLDELRRNVQLALKGTPDLRTPSQRRHDDWLAYLAAKEKYERNDRSAPGRDGGAGSRPQEGPQDRPADGQEQESIGPGEGLAPAP